MTTTTEPQEPANVTPPRLFDFQNDVSRDDLRFVFVFAVAQGVPDFFLYGGVLKEGYALPVGMHARAGSLLMTNMARRKYPRCELAVERGWPRVHFISKPSPSAC